MKFKMQFLLSVFVVVLTAGVVWPEQTGRHFTTTFLPIKENIVDDGPDSAKEGSGISRLSHFRQSTFLPGPNPAIALEICINELLRLFSRNPECLP